MSSEIIPAVNLAIPTLSEVGMDTNDSVSDENNPSGLRPDS